MQGLPSQVDAGTNVGWSLASYVTLGEASHFSGPQWSSSLDECVLRIFKAPGAH